MNKKLLAIIIGLIVLPTTAREFDNTWYAGVSYGYDFGDEEYSSGPAQQLKDKYGLVFGYRLNRWFSLEAGYAKHESISETFCDYPDTNNCVVWKRDHQYSFVGAKGTLRMARDKLAFSWGLAGIFGDYDSNFDSQSFNYLSPSFSISWLMSQKLSLSLGAEHIKYPVGNKQDNSVTSHNLVLTMEL